MENSMTNGAASDAKHERKGLLPSIGPVRRLHPLYSRIVTFLKFMFPVIALLLVGVIIAWPYVNREDIQRSIGFSAGGVVEEEEPSMVNPRYTGTDKDRQPFSVTADLARNMVLDTARVELEMPKADITLDDGTWLVITSQSGVYERDGQVLDLVGTVNLFHDQGYEINTDVVRINLEARTAESAMPVQGHGPIGTLQSQGFRLNNNTGVIVFTGQAKLTLYPDVMGGAQ